MPCHWRRWCPGSVEDNGNDTTHLGSAGNAALHLLQRQPHGVQQPGNRRRQQHDEGASGNGGVTTPVLESIAEFRISTSNYGADIGQHSGAIIEIATKGGTKKFHGSAYEYARNDVMDANDWFINQTIAPPGGDAPKTPLKWNIFGYTLGGPVLHPGPLQHRQAEDVFLLVGGVGPLSRRYRHQRQCPHTAHAPRRLQRVRDPSSANANPIVISQGCVVPTVNGVPTDTIPSINPNAAALLNGFVPLPNDGIDGYRKAPSVPTNYREEQIRVDQNLSDKASLFVQVSLMTRMSSAIYLPCGQTRTTTRRRPISIFPPARTCCT